MEIAGVSWLLSKCPLSFGIPTALSKVKEETAVEQQQI
jgi:hypothetical protein